MSHELHVGDCLSVVAKLPAGSCDLVYLDPPFFTQRRHRLVTRGRDREFSFDDVWASHAEYRDFLTERVHQFRRALTDRGSLFFHCDRTASHRCRAVLDEVFGESMFRAEIIWFYRRWSNAQRGLLPQHQTIFWYSKGDDYVFNEDYGAYSPSTNVDQLLQQRERDAHGKSVYARDPDGDVVPSKAKRGVPLGDVWDIPYLNPKAVERVGYPTQKPVLLLERIIGLASDPGQTVLDPFCGSGTTLVAAALQGRPSIGVDRSEAAVALARSRLSSPARTDSRLVAEGRASYEQVDEAAIALLRGLHAIPVQRNRGIDALIPAGGAGGNALVRVQRDGEPLDATVAALQRAAATKHAARLIVVATRLIPPGFSAPDGCVVIPSATAAIQQLLSVSPPEVAPRAAPGSSRKHAVGEAQLSLPRATG